MSENIQVFESSIKNSERRTGYASIDKPWLQYYDRIFDEHDIPDMSIYQLAYVLNVGKMHNTAIDLRTGMNGYSKGITISYKSFFKKIMLSAKASAAIGIKKNEIVPFILPNVPEARFLVYSSSLLGSISYPISPLMPASQLEHFINENEIKNLFIFNGFCEKYSSVLSKTHLSNVIVLDGSESLPNYIRGINRIRNQLFREKKDVLDSNSISYQEFVKYGKGVADITPYYEENHTAAIIGTSGTTGMPKGVCLSDRNINAAALSYKNGKVFEGNMMDALLPSIGYGISMLHHQTISGKYIYLIPELLTKRFPEALGKIKPDNFPGGPVHYINLRDSDLFRDGKVPRHNNLISGGATLPAAVERELNGVDVGYEESGINDRIIVRQGYGLSENTALGTFSKRGSYTFGSIGIPMPYVNMGIFKPDTDEELGYGEVGELCISGPSVMQKYLNNQEETDKVIKVHRDGERWIHTKDIAYMDENGHVFHVDRIKNIFMRMGFNVHPSKIADFINGLSIVKNSTVIGFDHPEEVCVPIAFVELDEEKVKGMTDTQIEEILKTECYNNLEETSVPYDFVLVDSLPINIGGKIDVLKIQNEAEIDLDKGKVKKRIMFNK